MEGLIKSFSCLWKICRYEPKFVTNPPLIWILWVLSWKCWCKERLRMLLPHWLPVSILTMVTRSNITTMSGPNRLSFALVTLPQPCRKDVFSSYFCAHGEHLHLLCITAAPAIVSHSTGLPPPLLACNDAVSFDTGVAYFKSSLSLVCSDASWQLSRHGSVSQFPSRSTTAQLWSLACPSYR